MDIVKAKRGVAFSSVLASAVMASAKLAVGLLTGSLGILSEAAHSLLDLGAAGLTYFAVSVSDRPADKEHPFGHGKIEAVSALMETGLLFITAAWIMKEAVERLLVGHPPVRITWYAIAVVVASMVIDAGRALALMRVARATRSQALEADALHFSSDILSSAVVLFGLASVALGYPNGDAVAAIGVSLFVIHIGYGMGKRTIGVLVDAAPKGIADAVTEVTAGVPGVARIDEVRARPAGGTVFVEVMIRVSRVMPLDRAKEVCDAVAVAIRKRVPEANPMVKAEPLELDDESIIDTVRLTAARRGLMVHDIGIYVANGQKHVCFDVEVNATLNLKKAHAIATGMEDAIRDELGDDVSVVSHIDPRHFNVVETHAVAEEEQRRLCADIEAAAREFRIIADVHNIVVQRVGDSLYVALHCLLPPDTPVLKAHDVTVEVEQLLKQRIPAVGRVVVHAEPLGSGED